MTSEQVYIAVAKVCGWTDIRGAQYLDGEWDVFGIPPGAEDERPLPDYCHDLNAALAAAISLNARAFPRPNTPEQQELPFDDDDWDEDDE